MDFGPRDRTSVDVDGCGKMAMDTAYGYKKSQPKEFNLHTKLEALRNGKYVA